MTTDITVLDHLVVVNLDIHIWTARKKLVPLDLGGAELPPEDLASLGSKRICNPDDLRSFGTLKARAVNLLEGNGIRFLSGWAVPDTRLPEIMRELAVIRDEFNTAKDAFLLRYDQSVQDWIAKHPQWGSIIAGSTVSEEYVRSRIDFRWQVFQVAQPAAVNATQNLDNLNDDIGQLGDTLFDEVGSGLINIASYQRKMLYFWFFGVVDCHLLGSQRFPQSTRVRNLRLPETYRYRKEGAGEWLHLCSR